MKLIDTSTVKAESGKKNRGKRHSAKHAIAQEIARVNKRRDIDDRIAKKAKIGPPSQDALPASNNSTQTLDATQDDAVEAAATFPPRQTEKVLVSHITHTFQLKLITRVSNPLPLCRATYLSQASRLS